MGLVASSSDTQRQRVGKEISKSHVPFMKILFIILPHLFAKKGQIQWRPLTTDPMNDVRCRIFILILLMDSQQVIKTHLFRKENSISLSSTLFFVAVSSKRHDLLSTHHSRY